MDPRDFYLQFTEETRRLGLNPYRLGGLAASGPDWEAPLLARMRALKPGVTWDDVFLGRESSPEESDSHLTELIDSFDANPDAYWTEQDRQAFVGEFSRVVLADLCKTLDLQQAIAVLRGLPDNAGWDAFQRALRAQ